MKKYAILSSKNGGKKFTVKAHVEAKNPSSALRAYGCNAAKGVRKVTTRRGSIIKASLAK